MLHLSVPPLPASAAAPSSAFSASAASAVPPASAVAVRVADGGAEPASLLERLLTRAQDVQETSTQRLSQHLEQLDSGRISTSDMLRLQADMGVFAVQVQMTVRVADETGRAIQTLSQRS